ncbi:STAS domain-containing protein [Peribacillus sp. SCS-26]|uniref:STAS domain-containing protein n=1 Tax=Paraperibacillus marinus TaxID=3115295 RepID=UPI003906AC73
MKRRVEDFIEYVPGIIWVVNSDLEYLDIKGEKLKEWGIDPGEVIGKTVTEFHQEGPDGMNTVNQRLAFSKGELTYRVDFAGSLYECKLNHQEEENVVIGVATDISRHVELEERIEAQDQEIMEASIPLIPVLEHAVVVPLIGELTMRKIDHIQRHTIPSIHGITRLQHVILDISGLSLIESNSISYLMDLQSILGLLGYKTILTGVQPRISKEIVERGLGISEFEVYSSLKDAVHSLIESARESG